MYQKLLNWPYLKTKKEFEEYCEKFKAYFDKPNYEKSLNYIKYQYETKHKWSISYSKPTFTAGVFTTSRAESMNAAIRRYVNSKK